MKQIIVALLILSTFLIVSGQNCNRESIVVKNDVFTINYSETLQQPLWVVYTSKNRPKNVDRGHMNFKKNDSICTSDNDDYVKNVWDKGHMAPAATYSDSDEHLKMTFSYLNCSLQNKYLNRGAWRILESKERIWDDNENLTIKVIPIYSKKSIVLPTGATIPDSYHKHIKFENQNIIKCFYFLNERPTTSWENHENTDNCDIIEDTNTDAIIH
jgi:DNA/RNA endonuclease G (NUC1)